MVKQFDKKDIDVIMKIWKDNNQRFQGFIDNQYWIEFKEKLTRSLFFSKNEDVFMLEKEVSIL